MSALFIFHLDLSALSLLHEDELGFDQNKKILLKGITSEVRSTTNVAKSRMRESEREREREVEFEERTFTISLSLQL